MNCRSLVRDNDFEEAREHYVMLLRLLRTLSVLPLTNEQVLELDGLRAERDWIRAVLRPALWQSGAHDAV